MSDFFDDAPPPNLAPWAEAGFSRGEARQWLRWRFSLREALSWRHAGVTNAVTAAQWRTSGVTPDTVGDWRTAGIGPSDAVRWHEFGLGLAEASRLAAAGHGPDSVEAWELRHPESGPRARNVRAGEALLHRFLDEGVPMDIAHGYAVLRGWHGDDALEWARSGIGVDEARLWLALGLTAPEAADLDSGPADVVPTWWRAGIPFDEVADWLGAGYSAQEAREQRSAGVSVDAAAELRAGRRREG